MNINKKPIAQADREDNYLVYFICGYLLIQAVHNFVISLNLNNTIWFVISRCILGILLLMALPVVIKRKGIESAIIEFVFCIAMLFSYFWGDVNNNFPSIAFNLLVVYLPMGYSCAALYNKRRLLETLYLVSFPIEILSIINGVYSARSVSFFVYSQTIGYLILLPLLVHIDHFIEKRTWYDVAISFIDFIFIIAYASRGPIVCIVCFICLSLLFSPDLSSQKKKLFSTFVLLFAIVVYAFLPSLVELILRAAPGGGQFSRTLRLLSAGALGYRDNREILFAHYISKILEEPVLGYGLASAWDMSSYPHNIFIELFLAIGIPFGAIASILLLRVSLRGILVKNETRRRLSIIFFSDLISLLWSGSFLMNSIFFVGLAILHRGSTSRKNSIT